MNNSQTIAEIIEHLAKNKGISISTLLSELEMNKNALFTMKNSGNLPRVENLVKIANYFGVPIDFLLGTGVFSNWNEICEHKKEIIATMEHFFEGHPEIIKILKFNDMTFASILNAIVNRIEFHDNDFDIYFSTSSEDDTKIKDPLTEQFIKIFEQLDFDDKVDVMQYVKNKK